MDMIREKVAFLRSAPSVEKLCYLLIFSIFLPYVLTAVVLLAVLVCILIKKEHRSKLFRAAGRKWLIAFSIPLFLSPLINGFWLGLAAGVGVVVLLLLGVWIAGVMKRRIFENCLNIAVFMSIPCALLAYVQKIFYTLNPIKAGEVYRSVSVFLNPNYYGGIIEFITLICLYKLLTNREAKKRLYYTAALGINFVALYCSSSLSACAAIGVATVVYLFLNRKFKAIGVVCGLATAAVLIVLAFPAVLPRLSFVEATLSVRLHIWAQTLNSFLQNPLIGIGTLGYWEVSAFETYQLFHQPHAHNILLDLLLNYGALGTASFIAFFVSQYGVHLKAALRAKYKPIGLLVIAVVVSILVHGLTDVTVLWHQTGLLMLFLLSGVSLAVNEQEADSSLRITERMQKGLTGLDDAITIRENVFVIEQGFVEEFDDVDPIAWHVVLYDGDTPIATGRTFLQDGQFVIGRVAVCKEYRELHVGSVVIRKLEEKIEELGGTEARLSAQVQAQGFYEKLGYHPENDHYHYDQHCLHIDMIKSLS